MHKNIYKGITQKRKEKSQGSAASGTGPRTGGSLERRIMSEKEQKEMKGYESRIAKEGKGSATLQKRRKSLSTMVQNPIKNPPNLLEFLNDSLNPKNIQDERISLFENSVNEQISSTNNNASANIFYTAKPMNLTTKSLNFSQMSIPNAIVNKSNQLMDQSQSRPKLKKLLCKAATNPLIIIDGIQRNMTPRLAKDFRAVITPRLSEQKSYNPAPSFNDNESMINQMKSSIYGVIIPNINDVSEVGPLMYNPRTESPIFHESGQLVENWCTLDKNLYIYFLVNTLKLGGFEVFDFPFINSQKNGKIYKISKNLNKFIISAYLSKEMNRTNKVQNKHTKDSIG